MKKPVHNALFLVKRVTNIGLAIILLLLLTALQSCSPKVAEKGKASFYADFFQGRKTSNGETFRQRKKTAAHRTLPFGTKVKVRNLKNGKTVTVRINDRGPFVEGRIIDLSKKAARKLGMVNDGVVPVEIKYPKKTLRKAKDR
ncbi:MAG: septal ring lytic transglycosylase RlpA family protein [Sphingobacteriales bacterium]|nr:MAG: septal ring lytic transglycosylase RlpA family protein [Sphingobacteriales bacterium]